MSAKPRCARCGRRWSKDSKADRDRWNVVTRGGGVTVGHICPRCQTDAEDTEAQVAQASLEYYRTPGGRLAARPKPELDDATRELAQAWIDQSQRQQKQEGTW